MRTYYLFRSEATPDLRAFTESAAAETLPADQGPWALNRRIGPDDEWTLNVSRAVVAAGIIENGFYLWGPVERREARHPVIESDRVEGTAVYGTDGTQIGTIRRLLIEKVSGRVLYVDVTFGGFLGLGVQHRTVPWDKLSYDTELEGYRTDVTEAQVQAAPAFYGDDQVWPDRRREQEMRDYWYDLPRGPI